MKACCTCKLSKPPAEFHRKSDAKDGRHPRCKECDNARRKALRDSQIETERAKDNARYLVRREAKRAYDREYYAARAEKIKADTDAYRRKHWERLLPIHRQRAMKRVAAKRKATPAWADPVKIREFYVAADFLSMVTGEWYHVDHMVPIQGKTVCGLHVEHNMQVLTGPENQSKGNRHWPDMP